MYTLPGLFDAAEVVFKISLIILSFTYTSKCLNFVSIEFISACITLIKELIFNFNCFSNTIGYPWFF